MIFGQLITYLIIIEFTKDLDYITAFSIVSIILIGIAMIFMLIVKEPHKKKSEIEEESQEPTLHKVKRLSREAYDLIKSDIVFLVCFIGVTITRLSFILFTSQQTLWVTSFIDSGVITEEESKDVL